MWNGLRILFFVGLFVEMMPCAQSQDSFFGGTDLTSPRIKQSEATIWYRNQAYRHCRITAVSEDQSMISVSSSSGELNIEWMKLPEQTRLALSSQYQSVMRQQQAAEDRKNGIIRLAFVRVFSVSTRGPLVNYGETICVITGLPPDKQYANGEDIRDIRVKISPDTYTYQSQGSGMVTARVLNYIGD